MTVTNFVMSAVLVYGKLTLHINQIDDNNFLCKILLICAFPDMY